METVPAVVRERSPRLRDAKKEETIAEKGKSLLVYAMGVI
jgi:hypothetical protein